MDQFSSNDSPDGDESHDPEGSWVNEAANKGLDAIKEALGDGFKDEAQILICIEAVRDPEDGELKATAAASTASGDVPNVQDVMAMLMYQLMVCAKMAGKEFRFLGLDAIGQG